MADLVERLGGALRDRYEIERELGQGGMAVVFLARDLRHDRRVAVKVLRPELVGIAGAGRFLREIGIAARLNHPHILALLDSGEADGLLSYVMPLVEGESLRDRLRRERHLPVEEAVRIAREVAEALDHAHGLGIIHRDIKPENILLRAGHAVVSDFGVARAVAPGEGDRLTGTGFAVGTFAYMSPEQAAGDAVDPRSDLYALGCVLYEMLAGELPFRGATPQAVLARKATDPVPRIRVVRDTVPEALEAVVLRVLSRLPADRHPSAARFAEALSRSLLHEAGQEPRTRPLARSAGAALLVGVLALGTWWALARGGGDEGGVRSLAVLPFENLTGDEEQDYLVAGMHDALIGELARLGGLQVISRRSVLRYAGSDVPITGIARDLKVDAVVAASFARQADSVRLSVQLLGARRGERSLWGDIYAREAAEALSIHGELAGAIARAGRVRLSPEEEARLAAPRRVNREAYEAYLRGRFAIAQGTPESVQRGLAYLHEANERDPADPFPYVGLALGYSILGHGPRPEVLPRATAAALRALELDPTLAEPHAVLAQAKLYREWDWEGAEEAFRMALERNPTLADARAHYAWYFDLMQQYDRALEEMRRTIESDPLDPTWVTWLSWIHQWIGQIDEAVAEARRALEMAPDRPDVLVRMAASLLEAGSWEEALPLYERAAALAPGQQANLAYAWARTGRTEDARRLAAEIEARGPGGLNLFVLPQVLVLLGEHDRALHWLERIYDIPHPWAPWTARIGELEPLHGDPRFQALVARLKLPG